MPGKVQLRPERFNVAFQPAQSNLPAAADELEITAVKAWTVREPGSQRTYSVVKIQTRSGLAGFGECAPLSLVEIRKAKAIIVGRPAMAFEAAAPLLADVPTARAALNVAMLDVVGQRA